MKKYHRPAKYGVVACLSAVIDWIVFSVLMIFMGSYYIHAQMISRISGGFFSFITNKYWSFDSKASNRTLIEGRRFLLLFLVSYSTSLVLLFLFVDGLGISPYVAKLMTDTSCLVLNFVVMQAYVFRDRQGFTHIFQNGLKKFFR